MQQEREREEVKANDNKELQDAVNAFMSGDTEVDAVAAALEASLRSMPRPTHQQLVSCKVGTAASWRRLDTLHNADLDTVLWRWLRVVGTWGWVSHGCVIQRLVSLAWCWCVHGRSGGGRGSQGSGSFGPTPGQAVERVHVDPCTYV